MQVLQAINCTTITLHSASFLTCTPFWTGLYLKDSFLCLQVAPKSLFNWEDPETEGQLTWTQLPYRIKNSHYLGGGWQQIWPSHQHLCFEIGCFAFPSGTMTVPWGEKKVQNYKMFIYCQAAKIHLSCLRVSLRFPSFQCYHNYALYMLPLPLTACWYTSLNQPPSALDWLLSAKPSVKRSISGFKSQLTWTQPPRAQKLVFPLWRSPHGWPH